MFILAVLCLCLSSLPHGVTETITITPNGDGNAVKMSFNTPMNLVCSLESDPGDPTPQLNWFFDSQQISRSDKYDIQESFDGDRVTTSNLTIHNLDYDGFGTYRCENTRTNNAEEVRVHVYIVPNITTNGDKVLSEVLNTSVLLVCKVSGGQYDGLPVAWRKDDESIPTFPGRHDIDGDGIDDFKVLDNSSLIVINASMEDVGTYTCTVEYYVDGERLTESRDIIFYEIKEGAVSAGSYMTTTQANIVITMVAMVTLYSELCVHLFHIS